MKKKKRQKSNFAYFLEFIPVWLILKLTRPFPLQMRGNIVGSLASFLVMFLPPIRNRAYRNLDMIMPELTKKERRRITRGSAFHTGKTLIEVLSGEEFLKNPPESEIIGEGFEQLKQALKDGKGAVVTSAHFGQWESMRQSIESLGQKIGAVYAPNRNPYYEKVFFAAVQKREAPLYAKGTDQVKNMVKYAASGGVIGILSDQRFPKGELIPFMGFNAWTSPAPAGIAMKLGIPLFVVMNRRVGNKVVSHFLPAITPADPITMMKEVHGIFEDFIRETPEQWYWFHKRWSSVPKDKRSRVE